MDTCTRGYVHCIHVHVYTMHMYLHCLLRWPAGWLVHYHHWESACKCIHVYTCILYIIHIQYASKKTSHKRAVQRCDRSRSNPVQNPFKTRTNPVRVSRSQRPVLIPVLTAIQTAVSCTIITDGAARPQQRALGSTRV